MFRQAHSHPIIIPRAELVAEKRKEHLVPLSHTTHNLQSRPEESGKFSINGGV